MNISNKRKRRIYVLDFKDVPKDMEINKFIEEWKEGMHKNTTYTYYYGNKKQKKNLK